jgi:diguanylate cyclase (GGDEF)-like protein/PAS domain S-box-containing protein
VPIEPPAGDPQSQGPQEQLQYARELFQTAFEHAPVGIALVTPDGYYTRVNQALCDFLGYSERELLGLRWQDVTKPSRLAEDSRQTARLLRGDISSYQLEKEYVHARGHHVWGKLSAALVRDSAGEPLFFVCQIEDIGARKLAEQKLVHQALHDPLTGVGNRLLFMDRLGHALARADRHTSPVAVLFFDLDHFKNVNDTLGHRAGDEVLITSAKRIQAVLRPSDTVARLGGDEFALLCEDMAAEQDVVLIAQRLCESFVEPMSIGGESVAITASIGIAFAQKGDNADILLGHADAAMYRVKEGSRGSYEIYLDAL